jgi:small neutral amino acid transporter SnatA (MarC family)
MDRESLVLTAQMAALVGIFLSAFIGILIILTYVPSLCIFIIFGGIILIIALQLNKKRKKAREKRIEKLKVQKQDTRRKLCLDDIGIFPGGRKTCPHAHYETHVVQ